MIIIKISYDGKSEKDFIQVIKTLKALQETGIYNNHKLMQGRKRETHTSVILKATKKDDLTGH